MRRLEPPDEPSAIWRRQHGPHADIYLYPAATNRSDNRIALSDNPIMGIAFTASYESQQSFTVAFKAMYKLLPARSGV